MIFKKMKIFFLLSEKDINLYFLITILLFICSLTFPLINYILLFLFILHIVLKVCYYIFCNFLILFL